MGLEGVPGVTPHPAPKVGTLTVEWMSDIMEHHIDGVLGVEILRGQILTIDPQRQIVTISQNSITTGSCVPIQEELNLPLVDIEFDGKVLPTIFDTGAPIGYVTKAMTQGLRSTRSMQDFYPLYGYFTTEVFDIPVRLGDCEDIVSFGVLPDKIEYRHLELGLPTIIGLGLLDRHQISISLNEALFKLCPLQLQNPEHQATWTSKPLEST